MDLIDKLHITKEDMRGGPERGHRQQWQASCTQPCCLASCHLVTKANSCKHVSSFSKRWWKNNSVKLLVFIRLQYVGKCGMTFLSFAPNKLCIYKAHRRSMQFFPYTHGKLRKQLISNNTCIEQFKKLSLESVKGTQVYQLTLYFLVCWSDWECLVASSLVTNGHSHKLQ